MENQTELYRVIHSTFYLCHSCIREYWQLRITIYSQYILTFYHNSQKSCSWDVYFSVTILIYVYKYIISIRKNIWQNEWVERKNKKFSREQLNRKFWLIIIFLSCHDVVCFLTISQSEISCFHKREFKGA